MQAFASKLATLVLLLALLAAAGVVQASGIEDGFDPDANGTVYAIAQQRNGQILLGGKFTTIGGATRNRVARVNNDGSRSSFNPDVGGGSPARVLALHEQPDGSILMGGSFITVSSQSRSNIARVSAAGVLDTGFDPGTDGTVRAFESVLSADGLSGAIYVAGDFDSIGSAPRSRIARLLADGSVDSSFVPPHFDGPIYALKLQVDGRIVVAGQFTTIDGIASNAPVARLNVDGSLDSTFSAPPWGGSFIQDLAVQSDGRILIAGYFTRVDGQARNYIARLHADGELDAEFVPQSLNDAIFSMRLQSDGRIMVAGAFNNSAAHSAVARLHANGSFDTSFDTFTIGTVFALVQQADGKYAIGGDITHANGRTRNHLARLEANGKTDTDFIADRTHGQPPRVNVLALQTDGKVLAGSNADASGNSVLKRLRNDGWVDDSFACTVDGVVNSLISYPDDTVLVAGEFSTIGQRIARLLSDGTVDSSFNASADGKVNATALQRNGRILLGGAFSHVNTLARHHVARLFNNGAADLSYHPVLNGDVYAITIQVDGKSLIGGDFTVVNGIAKPYLVRLNTNGTIDASFDADVDDAVRAIATDANGRIFIGGGFTKVDSIPRVGIARLQTNGDLDPSFIPPSASNVTSVLSIAPIANGRVVIGGYSLDGNTSAITGFVRLLSSNGSQSAAVDPDFNVDSIVTSVLVQKDGKLLFGGDFYQFGDIILRNIARFAQVGSAIESIQLNNGTDLSWARKGSAPELIAAPQVLWSLSCCDSADFNPLPSGIMSRSGNVWTLTGTPNLGADTLWLRAVSIAGDGGHGVGTIESPIIMLPPDRIFADGFD